MSLAEQIARTLPEGYEFRSSARAWMASRADAAAVLTRAGYGPESNGALTTSALAGRRPLLEMTTPSGILLVRRFSHGGLLRGITRSRFSDPGRPFRELCASARLAAHGVPTPEVVAARARRASGFGWSLDLVTRRVEGAIDVGKFLELARRGQTDHAELRRVASAFGTFVRRLHAIGFLHSDLTLDNVLVQRALTDSAAPKLWIVDLEGARFAGSLRDADRRGNLQRLARFVLRRESQRGSALRRTDFARFMRAYDPERWKADWIAVERSLARRRIWHSIGWMIESWRVRRTDAAASEQASTH
jgi:tRNA A-37 threonylcarbamoyl transferase component Bud32